MVSRDALSQQATLITPQLRLEQLGPEHFGGVLASLQDEEAGRLTGTHAAFTPEAVQRHLTALPGRDDRADWAVIRLSDEAYLGEVVLNDLDADSESMNFRIALSGEGVRGQGYGTEVTRAAVDYALDVVKLHRLSLGVHAFNPRAQRVYEKCGFVLEGTERDALLWNGIRVDQHIMSLLATDPRTSG